MKIVVLAVGRPREKRLASLADEYLARIRPAGLVGVERVPDVAARPAEAVEREGQELLKRIRPRDCVVLLREDGTERSSRELASFLAERMEATAGYRHISLSNFFAFSKFSASYFVPSKSSFETLSVKNCVRLKESTRKDNSPVREP